MKIIFKKVLSPRIYQHLRYPLIIKRAVMNCWYDSCRFLKFSRLSYRPGCKESFSAIITMEYHKLEKALTLPSPKKVYGYTIARNLITLLEGNDNLISSCREDYSVALAVLEDYHLRMKASDDLECQKISGEIDEKLGSIRMLVNGEKGCKATVSAGVTAVSEENENIEGEYEFFLKFMQSRKSVRNFAKTSVPKALIEKAINAAKFTPSVCNRQPWKAFYIDERKKIDEALNFQNGNSGFGYTIPGLLVVTSSIKHFPLSGERNQSWIDGGMFSMSLLLALKACGLGCCALNWGVDSYTDKKAKKAIGIPESANIIMMIAVGYPQKNFKVCKSHRKATTEFLGFL